MTRPHLILAASILLALTPAVAAAADPKVPPAKDAAGAPVAVIATGIDYTDAALTTRLARDGEGNIIGWDFIDNDIFPFAKDAASNAYAKLLVANTGVKLVPVRVAATDYRGVAGAASFVSHTPATVVAVTVTSTKKEDWAVFTQAAQHFKQLLFVVPAGEGSAPSFPANLELDNVVSVTLPAELDTAANVAFAAARDTATATDAAVAFAAAVASCHAAVIGDGDGKTRKQAILAKLAQPRSVSRVPLVSPCPL